MSYRRKKGRLSFFNRLVLFGNIIAAVTLILGYCSAFVSPERFWISGFLSLGLPLVMITNILFIVYWLFVRKKLSLISLVTLAAGLNTFMNVFQVNFDNSVPEEIQKNRPDKLIKVVSFNVRLFDLYNWKDAKETRKKIFNLLEKEKADLICFQEYFTSDKGEFQNTDTLEKILGLPYHHIGNIKNIRDTDHWGIATFSRFPVINKGTIVFSENIYNNACIYSDIKIGADTLRIYNLHLQSIHFVEEDYRFVENIKNENDKKRIKGSQQILSKLKAAFPKRAHQSEVVAAHIKSCPYPVILCGDFNDPPTSYSYRTLFNSRPMEDAFVESGWGIGRTYTGSFPSFRIDYILYDERFNSYRYKKTKVKLSDHYPISCVIDLGEGKGNKEIK